MKPLLPDANVLVYETIEDSPRHEEAIDIIDSASETILPSIIVHEYIWVMVKKTGVLLSFVEQKLQEYLDDPRSRYIVEHARLCLPGSKTSRGQCREPARGQRLYNALYGNEIQRYTTTFDEKLKKRARSPSVETAP